MLETHVPTSTLGEYVSSHVLFNDRLSALELAKTLDMGHGWASDVTLSNIHERSSLTSRFVYIRIQKSVLKHHNNAFEAHFKIRILVL